MLCRHRRFIFAVVLLSYLCRVADEPAFVSPPGPTRDSVSTKPKISPAVDQIVLKEGEPLELSCSGNSNIFYTYPATPAHFESAEYHTSTVEINKTRDEYGKFWYHLLRPKTVFEDTGWYGCSYHPILTTIHKSADPKTSEIYVYVQSTTVRFVEEARLQTLAEYRPGSVIIPCRPTSPDAKVNIAGFLLPENEKFDFNTSYDPKSGFLLFNYIPTPRPVTFKCTIAPDQEVSYIVRRWGSNPLPEPIINNTFPHLIIGESLYVRCTISVPKLISMYDIFWIQFQQEHRITTSIDRRQVGDDIIVIDAMLVIKNVTYEDRGMYECKVTSTSAEKTLQMNLQVHDSISPFIHLTARDSNSHYKRRVGDAVLFVVDVEAYPLPELKWLNKHGDELNTQGDEIPMLSWSRGPKLLADSACCKPTLKIHNLNLNDMGIYSIQADNRYKKESLNFTLELLAEQKVYMIMPHSHYFHNQVAKVECHVEAFPRPNITWSYRKCPNYPSCDDGILEYLTNSGENGTVTHLVSTVSATFEMSGELTCSACNIMGCRSVTENILVSDELGEFGIIETMNPVVEGDEWELICAASIRNYLDFLDWSNKSGRIVQSDRISIDRGRSQFMYTVTIRIHNVKIEDGQDYYCEGMSVRNYIESDAYRLEVTAARAPIITDTNLNKSEITFDLNTQERKRVYFYCLADGAPKPSISWFKDGAQLVVNDKEHKFTNNSQQLELEYPLLEIDSGEYMCRAENRIGKAEVSQRIKFLTIKEFKIVTIIPVPVIISLVTLAVVVLILVIYVGLKIRHHWMDRRKLEEAGLLHFETGAIESLNPNLAVDEQADLLPYDKKWEFPREKLELGERLGSGAFGVVLKAEALGICKGAAVTTVAVKMVRRSPNITHICALSSELKILVHLGKHLNVVNLLGACTKNILKHELLVIVEFCRFGNLQNYLFRHRSGFINQIDPATDKLDLSIGHDLQTRTDNVSSTNKADDEQPGENANAIGCNAPACHTSIADVGSRIAATEIVDTVDWVKSPSASINRNLESDSAQCDAAATDFQSVDLSADDPTFNSDSTLPGWSSCRGDYKDSDLKPIRTQDLLSWAFQVARGMEYLSQRRILHGDLAARNILLAEDNVVKICDFGLAKSMYKEDIYKKKSDSPLPVKWLAIETMRDRSFSTQSDIWSFGIVLWEFFTLAETPYPGIEAEMLYQKLADGYRMQQPEYSTRIVYNIMSQCWNAKPSLRPSFTELVESIGNLLEDNVRAQYIELNAPYMDMNRTLFEDGSSDYLSMVSDPNHVVYSSSSYSCEISSASGTTVDCGNSGIKFKDAVKTSPMLDEEDEDPYLKPITVDKRRAEIARMEALAKDRVMHPDQGYANCNPSNRLELTDLNKKSDKVAKRRRSSSIRETRRAA